MKCHGGRGSNKKCQLTPPDILYCSEIDAKKQQRRESSTVGNVVRAIEDNVMILKYLLMILQSHIINIT
jgi:hypothetical protein